MSGLIKGVSVKDKRLHYDLEKMNTKLTRETSKLKLLYSFFTQSLTFCEQLVSSLTDIRAKFIQNTSNINESTQQALNEVFNFETQVMVNIQSFTQDIIEPLNIFLEHYEYCTKEFVQGANRINKEVEEEKNKIEKRLSAYYLNINILDKLQDSYMSTKDTVKLESIKGKVLNHK